LFRFNNTQILKNKKKQKNCKTKKERKETGPAHTPRLGVRRLGRTDQGGV
jgi:hypothetical protein